MSADRTLRVAVVQATPVVMDGPASVAKACDLIAEAGAGGARLIALPEGFVPLMPRPCWGHRYSETMNPDAADLHRALWENAVDVDGPLAARLARAAKDAGAWVAIGVNERSGTRPGRSGTPCSGSPPTAVSRDGTASWCRRCTSAASGARAPATTST